MKQKLLMGSFKIEDFIEKNKNKDFHFLIADITIEVTTLDTLVSKKGYRDNYNFNKYRDLVGDFLFWLNTGVTPGTTGLDGLRNFLPIIKNLVEKGQLKQSALGIFE